MSAPRVSCLLPVYNGEVFLEEAIASILGQTFGDFEIVVVDDGSTDGTADILARLARADPRIRVHRQANGGIVAALNAGLGLCRGEFVARMDADDIALPDRFEVQVRYLDEHQNCVLVGGVAKNLAPDGSMTGGGTTGGRHLLTDLSVFPPKVAVSMHPLVTVRREALVAIGGYRSDFPHAEDYDLFIRLAKLGTVDNPDRAVLIYRRHEGAISLKHLELQERSAALAEVEACTAFRQARKADARAIPAWVIEPYVRFRILRRYFSVDRGKADALLPKVVKDISDLSPRTLLNRDYWTLRVRMAASVARSLARG